MSAFLNEEIDLGFMSSEPSLYQILFEYYIGYFNSTEASTLAQNYIGKFCEKYTVTPKELLTEIDNYFKSGNNTQIERAVIPYSKWQKIQEILNGDG